VYFIMMVRRINFILSAYLFFLNPLSAEAKKSVHTSTGQLSFVGTCMMMMNKNSSIRKKEIYNIPGSGWTSPTWNWGYANGTGHDCALLCRRKFSTKQQRQELIQELLHPAAISSSNVEEADSMRSPPFEEVKLILGLTIQRARWDGTDGGSEGYSEVLGMMANAERYESNDEELNSKLFVKDMVDRFHLIAGNEIDGVAMDQDKMKQMVNECSRLRTYGRTTKIIRNQTIYRRRRK
jgi:hypothetical protein